MSEQASAGTPVDAPQPSDAGPVPASKTRGLGLLIFTCGMASLGGEIAAARLLAPYFGASTVVWSNTIAVVLLALSLGYWLGGRLADSRPHERDLRRVVLVASLMLAAIPLAAGPLLSLVAEAFEQVSAATFLGSLAAVLLLAGVPMLALGTVTPWALRLSLGEMEQSGQVAGRLYAISTLGSLAGVFAVSLLLVPLIGTQRTFILLGLLLSLTAAARPSVVGRAAFAVPAVLALGLLLPPGVTKPAESDGTRVLAERETPYQYARVVEVGERRKLELNEGQAAHSIFEPSTPLTGGVWDGYLVTPFAVLREPPRRMVMLGNAGGTVSRAYGRYYPETEIDGVEIDGGVSELGERYFALRSANPRLRVVTDDARPFLRNQRVGYDLIAIDAYRQPYIPFYLATREFFALTRSRLAPGGAVVVNVGHPAGQFSVERALTATLRTEFRYVYRHPIESTSTLLIASDLPPQREPLRTPPAQYASELLPAANQAANTLAEGLDGGMVLTDDRAPVEWLTDSAFARYVLG